MFFIHSLVVDNTHTHTPHVLYPFISCGPLGRLHILAVVNDAAVNIGVHISFQITVFLPFRYILRSGTAGSYGNSVVFWGTPHFILFSIVAVPIYIPTSSVKGFPSSHISSRICYLCSFWWWPLWQVWGDKGQLLRDKWKSARKAGGRTCQEEVESVVKHPSVRQADAYGLVWGGEPRVWAGRRWGRSMCLSREAGTVPSNLWRAPGGFCLNLKNIFFFFFFFGCTEQHEGS